jgi:hypothetical protein
VTVTDGNGCTASASTTVSAGVQLAIADIPDAGPLCPGSAVGTTLISAQPVNTGIQYSWTGGAGAGLANGTGVTGLNPAIPAFTAWHYRGYLDSNCDCFAAELH